MYFVENLCIFLIRVTDTKCNMLLLHIDERRPISNVAYLSSAIRGNDPHNRHSTIIKQGDERIEIAQLTGFVRKGRGRTPTKNRWIKALKYIAFYQKDRTIYKLTVLEKILLRLSKKRKCR